MNEKREILCDIADTILMISNCLTEQFEIAGTEELEMLISIVSQIKLLYEKIGLPVEGVNRINHEIEKGLIENNKLNIETILRMLQNEMQCIHKMIGNDNYPQKKIIKVKYVDFYPEFVIEEHWLYKILKERYIVLLSEDPEYLIYSCFGTQYLRYDCIRIFISNEALYPDFNVADYAVTYSDFEVTDRLLPNRDAFEDLKHNRSAYNIEEAKELLAKKKEFCNFVFSNGNASALRECLLDSINEYKKVKSGGKHRNNIGYLVDNLEDFQSCFKFSIACENSFYPGYTTEKIINAFNAKTIPIYWGNPKVDVLINPNAFIDVNKYDTLEEVVDEIIRLDNDDTAYLEMLMQPILIDENMPMSYLQRRKEFVYNIFDQSYDEAFRRNTGLRGQWHNDWLCYLNNYPQIWFTKEKNYFVKGENPKQYDGPLVSILIPVYNRAKIIKQTVDSALAQTYINFEIVIVDNCSTDETYSIIKNCYSNDDRVRIYKNERNIGPVNNWKKCLSYARGEYIKILWSDDLIGEDFLATGVAQLENDKELALVFTATEIFCDDGKSWIAYQQGRTGVRSCAEFYDGIFKSHKDFPVSPGCAIFRTKDVKILDDIPNQYGINCNSNGAGIDLMIFLHALSKYDKYYYIEDTYSYFRFHAGSITATNNLYKEYLIGKKYFVDNYLVGEHYKELIYKELSDCMNSL